MTRQPAVVRDPLQLVTRRRSLNASIELTRRLTRACSGGHIQQVLAGGLYQR